MASNKSSTKDTEFRRLLYRTAHSLSWFLPRTEEEVAALETQIESSDYEDPGDPFEALDRELGFSKRPPTNLSVPAEYEQELRRAARLCKGEIPDEVEQRMRRDRERAEREREDGR